jgi:hypothetical protein
MFAFSYLRTAPEKFLVKLSSLIVSLLGNSERDLSHGALELILARQACLLRSLSHRGVECAWRATIAGTAALKSIVMTHATELACNNTL